ncbi:GNAT family N-acetyltransferase [Polymorphobacter sp. PAMC 29334]|uniref:GNAT family N-acetyltransferase n=1 Tax=Polymorphobacter sp. PAMC 29334 TaxID=2862331 RepID=UPI001C6636B2|nr:GNAT family N-acetyltransferase [Polymorphobacter sp. PAMC 29334]QYE34654.1 GNAT family N-acetyltransferase [Polymorphobacter sp. PAMC 29334]
MLTLATLRRTINFTTQFEGESVDGRPVYIRCKHGELRVHAGEAGGTVLRALDFEPLVHVEFEDDHRSELDWIEIEALTGVRYERAIGGAEIADASVADVDEIAAFMRRVRDTAMPYLPKLHDAEADRAFISGLIGSSVVRVARAERVIGFCSRRPGWVDQLYIDADWHGRGIGSRLLGEALLGAALVQLWTFQRNEAARIFYCRRGFDEVERSDGARNEEGEPDILMRWRPGLRP